MFSQLRVYTINKGELEEFVKVWTNKIYPLNLKLGMRVDGAWTIKESNQFVWVLRYDGPEDWKTKRDQYFDSSERKSFDPDPARYIARVEEWLLSPVKLN